MSTTRFLLTNLAVANGSLLNGTGGGAPATVQATGFPMTNALTADRYTLWKSSTAPASPVYYDVDLGLNRSVRACGVHGLRTSSISVFFVNVYYATAATGYPPSSGGAWTSFAAMNAASSPRDLGSVNGSNVLARFWRFEFVVSGSGFFSVGKLSLGLLSDLGIVYSPGTQAQIIRYRTEAATPAGQPVINDFGDAGRLWTLNFESITSATLSTLQSLASQTGSFIYVDDLSAFYEVALQGGSFSWTRRFTDLYSAQVNLQRLP